MSIAAIVLASLGFYGLLTQKKLLRLFMALQQIALSIAFYIARPAAAAAGQDAQLTAIFVLIGFFVLGIVGFALASRLLVLSQTTDMDDLRRLKH